MGNSFGVEKGNKEEDILFTGEALQKQVRAAEHAALSAADADSPTRITQERDELLKRNAKAQVMAMVTAALQSGPPHGNQAAARQDLYCAQMGGVNCCLASLLSPRTGHDSFDPNMFLVDDQEVNHADADTSVGSVLKEE